MTPDWLKLALAAIGALAVIGSIYYYFTADRNDPEENFDDDG